MNTRLPKQQLYDKERKWFYAAIGFFIVAVIAYMYFLSASVVHVVMRKEVDREMSALNSSISLLEADYIEAQHSVSEQIATLRGFTLTDDKIFIDRGDTTLVLSTN
jgi:hypothetical protein